MWPNYEVEDSFLYHRHFHTIRNIEFDTKPDEWDIYKHKINYNGKIERGFQSSTGASSYTAEDIRGYGAKNRLPKEVTDKMLRQHQHIEIDFQSSTEGKKGKSPLTEDTIRNIHEAYHDKMWQWLTKLAPEKLQHYQYTELNVVNTGRDYIFPVHSDSKDKLLSVVIYIAPEINEGTWLYEDHKGKNPQQIEWKPNRAFAFSRNDNTWHSYKADGIRNRLTLVYNLRSARKGYLLPNDLVNTNLISKQKVIKKIPNWMKENV